MQRTHWVTLAVVFLVSLAGCATTNVTDSPAPGTEATTPAPSASNAPSTTDQPGTSGRPGANASGQAPDANRSGQNSPPECRTDVNAGDAGPSTTPSPTSTSTTAGTSTTPVPAATTSSAPTTTVSSTAAPTAKTTTAPATTTTAPTTTTTPATTTSTQTTTPTTTSTTTTTTPSTTTTTTTPTTTTTTPSTTTTTTTPTTTTTTPSEPSPSDPDDPGASSFETGAGTVTSSGVEAAIHKRVNEIRSQNGFAALGHDATLASVARAHSEDMADRDFFAHTNPDGEQPWDRYGDVADTPCRTFGENIAMVTAGPSATDESVADTVVDLWMGSSGHRRNLLSSAWTEEGVGVYVTDGGVVYVTQDFCG